MGGRTVAAHTVPDNTPICDAELLVRELLMARSDGLGPRELAAFISGWTSALELVSRSDLLVPGASPELSGALGELVALIVRAQRHVLEED